MQSLNNDLKKIIQYKIQLTKMTGIVKSNRLSKQPVQTFVKS